MDSNYLVTQSNDLIEANHSQPLTETEQKLILTFVSMIQPEDKDFKVYSLSVSEFHKLLNLKGRENYKQIKELTKKILEKTIEIKREHGGFFISHWASHIEYIGGEGRIEFSFDPKLKPYLLQLQHAFKSYKLKNILNLNSYYSIRLYELLKKWEQIGSWEIELSTLHSLIGLKKKKSYHVYGNLKNRILNPAIEDINKNTDIKVTFDEIKDGRKVIRLLFYIKKLHKNKVELLEEPESVENNSNDKQIDNNEISDKKIKSLLDSLNEKCHKFTISYSVFEKMYKIATKIFHKEQIEFELNSLVILTNNFSKTNPIGFMLYLLKQKEKEFLKGLQPTFEHDLTSLSREIIPDWFYDYKNNQHSESLPKSPEELEEEERISKELKEILNKYSK